MKPFFYALLIILIAGCTGRDSSENEQVPVDTLSETTIEVDSADFGQTITNIPSLWKVEVQPDHSEKLEEPEQRSSTSTIPQDMINALNATYPDIRLDLTKISHDTAYISIPESDYLTQQVGSTGAYNYLATAVYNLTELNNVKFVNFKFKEGDHASPGTYQRDDFKKLR